MGHHPNNIDMGWCKLAIIWFLSIFIGELLSSQWVVSFITISPWWSWVKLETCWEKENILLFLHLERWFSMENMLWFMERFVKVCCWLSLIYLHWIELIEHFISYNYYMTYLASPLLVLISINCCDWFWEDDTLNHPHVSFVIGHWLIFLMKWPVCWHWFEWMTSTI